MQLELAQIPVQDGSVDVNLDRILKAIADSKPDTELLLFPEAALTGFPTPKTVKDVAEALDGSAMSRVRDAARAKSVGVAMGLAENDGGRFFNTTVLIDSSGETKLTYRKTHMWPAEVDMFEPGNRFDICEYNGMKVGILICYDIEFPETGRSVASLGADLLLVTAANMDPYGPVHRRAVVARAMENQVFAAYVNRTGRANSQLNFVGESAVINPFGDVICETGLAPTLLSASVDLAGIEDARRNYSYLKDARISLDLSDVSEDQMSRTIRN